MPVALFLLGATTAVFGIFFCLTIIGILLGMVFIGFGGYLMMIAWTGFIPLFIVGTMVGLIFRGLIQKTAFKIKSYKK